MRKASLGAPNLALEIHSSFRKNREDTLFQRVRSLSVHARATREEIRDEGSSGSPVFPSAPAEKAANLSDVPWFDFISNLVILTCINHIRKLQGKNQAGGVARPSRRSLRPLSKSNPDEPSRILSYVTLTLV